MLALRKRHIGAAAVMAISLSLTLSACGGSESATPTESAVTADEAVVALVPADLAAKGVITFGTELGYPPFEMTEADGTTLTGFDIDLATAAAELMGLKVEFKNSSFDSIIPSVISKRYDAGISSFTVTGEREKQVDFATYMSSGDAGVVPVGNPKGLALDTTLCGTKVGVLKGSTQETDSAPQLNAECKKAGKPEIAFTVIAASDQMPIALQSGRVESLVTDSANAATISQNSNGKFEVPAGPLLNPVLLGALSAKGSGVAQALQAAFQKLIDNGTYQQFADKYNLSTSVITTSEVNPKV
ncbi:MAG: ABC transporter substrate-binding protein [Candidatus Nanopelagicales bacterium]|nr:ABC transporter substrate-binding protein [Candidatus Nanopelagicales bacterium]